VDVVGCSAVWPADLGHRVVNGAQMERGHAMKQQHVLAKFNLSERCCHGGNTECSLNSFAWLKTTPPLVGQNIIC